MATCFIFAARLSENGALSCVLAPDGALILPLIVREFSELNLLQKSHKMLLVVSCAHFTIYHLQLPKLPAKKVRTTIAYALEDKLAEKIDTLHFSYYRDAKDLDYYWVAVCNRDFLIDLLAPFIQYAIHLNAITLDWCALQEQEAMSLTDSILVHDTAIFCGALSPTLIAFYLSNNPQLTFYTFTDSASLSNLVSSQALAIESSLWQAQRLQKNRYLLINNDYHQDHSHKKKRVYLAALVMSGLLLVSFIVSHILRIHTLNQSINHIDQKIATIYRLFFPQATHIISPRFRINQLLKSQNSADKNTFWILLNQLTEVTQTYKVIINQLRFYRQNLQVTFVASDFEVLDKLQIALKSQAIRVKQLQASSKDRQIIATLELSFMMLYWENLQERERKTLLLGGLCVLVSLLYVFIYSPLTKAIITKQQQIDEKTATFAWMQQIKPQSLPKKLAETTNGKLLTIMALQLKQATFHKFSYQLQQTGTGDIQLTFAEVPVQPFLLWLWTLNNQYAVILKKVTLERTKISGVVKVSTLISAVNP